MGVTGDCLCGDEGSPFPASTWAVAPLTGAEACDPSPAAGARPCSSPGDPSCHILPTLVYLVYSPTETQS
jgi:hypothetical protein